jgi:hypothetical protein
MDLATIGPIHTINKDTYLTWLSKIERCHLIWSKYHKEKITLIVVTENIFKEQVTTPQLITSISWNLIAHLVHLLEIDSILEICMLKISKEQGLIL